MTESLKQQAVTSEKNDIAGKLYSGSDVLLLSPHERLLFAQQVSEKLATKPTTMLQWTPEQLVESMQQGRSTLIIDADHNLMAFAQVWEYQYDLFRYIPYTSGFGQRTRRILEAGSWLNFAPPGKGIGMKVFQEAIVAGKNYDPTAMIIAIIEQNNQRANEVMVKLGGEKIGEKQSPVLKDEKDNPALMFIYDVTEVSEK